MPPIKEYDNVKLLHTIDASLVNPSIEFEKVRLPAGTEGMVALVHGPAENPLAFEVEFELVPLKKYALASVDAKDVELTWSRPT